MYKTLILFSVSILSFFVTECSSTTFDFFRVITANERATENNIVYSPTSIESCLKLVLMGAEGNTEQELRNVLKLGNEDKSEIAKNFNEFFHDIFNESIDNGPTLKMVNRVYLDEKLELTSTFKDISENYFGAQAEQLNFEDTTAAMETINTWVEEHTENRIQNLLQDDDVDSQTSVILVNAIYLKARWFIPFDPNEASKLDFYESPNKIVQVQLLKREGWFGYAELPDLDAKVLQLQYYMSALSMLIILPNQIDGLEKLEQKLATTDLNSITSKFEYIAVDIRLPKFKVEFEIDLKTPLQELGINDLFEDSANLSSFFSNAPRQKVSKVVHKAIIEVNDRGTEPSAIPYRELFPDHIHYECKLFYADHPFVFIIRDEMIVFFAGHLVKF